jgi:uncharacterized protein (TIGR03083 family)
MNMTDYLDAIERESDRFITAVDGSLDQTVAHCDDWLVAELAAHVGFVWTVATTNVASATDTPTKPGPEATAPEDQGALVDWLRERRSTMIETLAAADPADPAWGFAGDLTAGFWQRRMAHETTVHRFDAECGAGLEISPIPSDLARDGIDEYTVVGLRFSSSKPTRDYPTESLHLHRTDGEGEWMFLGDGEGGVTVTMEHGKGAAAIRGPAANLLLWIWGRPVDDVEVFGDPDVAARWQAVAP